MLPSIIIALVEKLKPLLPDEFSREVLSGSVRVLWDDNNPIRINLFALGIREMVRNVLELAAPDIEIQKCRWFLSDLENRRREASSGGRQSPEQITRKDRMIYATQGGLATICSKSGD
jgi:hypothetical protein